MARVLIILIFCLLSACSRYTMPSSVFADHGSSCQKLTQVRLIEQLRERNVQVNFYNDNIKLKMPLRAVFYGWNVCNGRLNNSIINNDILDMIAKFLRCYQKISVRVMVYTRYFNTAQNNIKCAKVWAQKIADYLWVKQIDTRLLYSDGFSGSRIAYSGLAANRIEIIVDRS